MRIEEIEIETKMTDRKFIIMTKEEYFNYKAS